MKTKPEFKVPVHTTSLIVRQSEKHRLLFEYFLRNFFLVTFVANSGPQIQRTTQDFL